MSIDTKTKIIQAARKLFVESGFNGTSIRDIAKKSDVQVSLIYHHFENKLSLWREVKESFLGDRDGLIADEISQAGSFAKVVEIFIHYRLEFCASNPDGARMFDWQRLELKDQDKSALVNSTTLKLWKALKEKLISFQNEDKIYTDYSSDFIIAMMFGSIVSPFLGLGGFSLSGDEEIIRYKELLIKTFTKGLQK